MIKLFFDFNFDILLRLILFIDLVSFKQGAAESGKKRKVISVECPVQKQISEKKKIALKIKPGASKN